MKSNQLSFSLSSADLDSVMAAIKTLEDILMPKLINLTPAERSKLAKMADKTIAFVQKSHDQAKLTPDINPPYLNLSAMELDLETVFTIRKLMIPLKKIIQKLDDTSLLAGSEAYAAALIYYAAVKDAAKRNVSGAKTIYEDLKMRFPSRHKSNPIPPAPPTE